MARSRHLLPIVFWLVLSPWGLAQRGAPTQRTTDSIPTRIEVHVVTDRNQPVERTLRVHLSSEQTEVIDADTNSHGVAVFSIVAQGSFQARVTGVGIETAQSEIFIVQPSERMHVEYVQVKLDQAQKSDLSKGSVTSTTALQAPDKARKEFNRGIEQLKKRDWEGAKKHFETAIERYPKFDAAYDTLGMAKQNSGDFAGAKAAYQTALQINDRNPNAQRDLAGILILERDWPGAAGLLKQSLSLDPQNAGALTMLAAALLEMGRLDEVIATAGKVHALEHQTYSAVHLILARAFELKGDRAAAVSEYRVFLREAPHDPKAAFAQKTIERLTATGLAANGR